MKTKNNIEKNNLLVDAIIITQSWNCHIALQHLLEHKRLVESMSEDGKISYANQQRLRQLEDNYITEFYRLLDFINTKRPLDKYYNIKLVTPWRFPDL